MKALRYLLIAFAAMTVLSVSAQSLAQEPQIGFQSTSSMVGSGTTLPMAVENGAYTTYEEEIYRGSGVIKREDDGFEDDPFSGHGDDPFGNPVGDAAWPLALCALAFALFRYVRKRTRA